MLTYITWCSVHNSFWFHNAHLHHVMQCMQHFFIPQHTRTSRDAVRTIDFDSTTHTYIMWCSVHNSYGFQKCTPTSRDAVGTTVSDSTMLTYIMWCSAHNSFGFQYTHLHHTIDRPSEFANSTLLYTMHDVEHCCHVRLNLEMLQIRQWGTWIMKKNSCCWKLWPQSMKWEEVRLCVSQEVVRQIGIRTMMNNVMAMLWMQLMLVCCTSRGMKCSV